MPVRRAKKKGKPGFRYGSTGRVYTYTPGNARSKANAHAKAEAQGKAIRASQHNK